MGDGFSRPGAGPPEGGPYTSPQFIEQAPGPRGSPQLPHGPIGTADAADAAPALRAAKTDWRPTVSYTANLTRVGRHWLGTDACWDRLSENVPEERRTRFLLENKGSQYPWYWSAFVLAGLFGISVCILNLRVKSLDRLK